jgi:dTDP-4-amino-4,6-dideoxygalactose transaminase
VSPSDERIPLAEPTIVGNASRYLEECLATNFVSSVGPFVGRFEQEFAAYVGTRHAVACASGTAALHLALRVLGVGPGDEVLVPTLTFVASANPVRYEGGTPVLIDSDDASLGMNASLVVDELDRRHRLGLPMPKAIEVVHLVGHPADLEPILDVADRHGIPVVEDAAEALGATWTAGRLTSRQVGSVGRIGCFSFNGNKIITTGGGGMLVTDDDALARRARHLSTQARLPGRAYAHDEVGYNYRLSNIAAALGVAQLEQLPDLLARRRDVAGTYDRALAGIPALRPARHAPWADPSYWLYTVELASGLERDRERLLDGLAEAGIEARPIWTPLHLQPLYADAPRLGGSVAERVFAGAVSLPSSSSLTQGQQSRVIEAIGEVVGAPAPVRSGRTG